MNESESIYAPHPSDDDPSNNAEVRSVDLTLIIEMCNRDDISH